MSCRPCHFSGSGTRHLARNVRLDAPDGELVGLRPEQVPAHADEVAEVQQPEDPEVAVADRILADVDLDAREAVAQHQEVRLAEAADGENAPARPRLDARRLERLLRLRAVVLDEPARSCRCVRTRAGRDRRQAGPAPPCWRGAGRSVRVLEAYRGRLLFSLRSSIFCLIFFLIASSTPFTKRPDSSPPNRLASSTASEMTTLGGTSGTCWSWYTAMRRISRSITAMRSGRQCDADAAITGSISPACSTVPSTSREANASASADAMRVACSISPCVAIASSGGTRPTSHW